MLNVVNSQQKKREPVRLVVAPDAPVLSLPPTPFPPANPCIRLEVMETEPSELHGNA